jgi:hypothetical protein
VAAGSTYTPIATTTLSSNAASYTFTSIPNTYTDLVLTINGGTTTNNQFRIGVGSGSIDTSAIYSGTQIYAYSSTVGTGREVNATNPYIGVASTTTSTHIVQFQNYSNTTTFKTWLNKGGDLGQSQYDFSSYMWRSTSAIDRIQINTNSGTIASGTIFALYGIAAA